MALELVNLNDADVRILMMEELNKDIAEQTLYISNRLKEDKIQEYIGIIRNAITTGTDDTFANDIKSNNLLKTQETRRTPSGGITTAQVPETAHFTLAEGEFNRFYLRAICLKAINQNKQIEVYRAKQVATTRSSSQALIGQKLNPQEFLIELRENKKNNVLGFPLPNSGLSGKLVD